MNKTLLTILLALSMLPVEAITVNEWISSPSSKSGNDAVVAVDAFGYIYVAGTYPSSNNGKDWKIVKYSPDSSIVWTQTKNGSANGDDYVYSIAVDEVNTSALPSSVNIYVTGSTSTANGHDCTTIKISSSGTFSWTATYNGSSNGNDIGRDVIVDASGNVYVTGECMTSGTTKDMITLKYNASGTQQWASVFNRLDYDDAAYAMCFDAAGNVLIAGYSSTSTGKDAAVVKYNTSGTELWNVSYAGASGLDDWANEVTSDNSSNIYFTGKTTHATSLGNFLTVKYNSRGTQQWTAIYDGPARLEDEAASLVYHDNNIYVTGKTKATTSSVTTFDYATIKYDNTGRVSWTMRYNGPGNGDDAPVKIVVDYAGDLIIAGASTGSGTGMDYFTIAYSTAGTTLWSERYYNPSYNGSDYATGMAADIYGNVYITGTGAFSSTDNKLVTVKYADREKTKTVVTGALEKLARGLLPESDNDTVKNIIYPSCDRSVDSFTI
jgi:hypothetical protein